VALADERFEKDVSPECGRGVEAVRDRYRVVVGPVKDGDRDGDAVDDGLERIVVEILEEAAVYPVAGVVDGVGGYCTG
jgi:hypothetical protein